jgi:hypothetical protein
MLCINMKQPIPLVFTFLQSIVGFHTHRERPIRTAGMRCLLPELLKVHLIRCFAKVCEVIQTTSSKDRKRTWQYRMMEGFLEFSVVYEVTFRLSLLSSSSPVFSALNISNFNPRSN